MAMIIKCEKCKKDLKISSWRVWVTSVNAWSHQNYVSGDARCIGKFYVSCDDKLKTPLFVEIVFNSLY